MHARHQPLLGGLFIHHRFPRVLLLESKASRRSVQELLAGIRFYGTFVYISYAESSGLVLILLLVIERFFLSALLAGLVIHNADLLMRMTEVILLHLLLAAALAILVLGNRTLLPHLLLVIPDLAQI